MRSLLVLSSLLVCYAVTPSPVALAQAPTVAPSPKVEQGIVLRDRTEVRCGPTTQYYVTWILDKDDMVEVVGVCETDPNWLKIRPPLGSWSWINSLLLTETSQSKNNPHNPRLFVVKGENVVPVLAGSRWDKREPNVEVAKVQPGTIVVALGNALTTSKGPPLMAMLPTPSEVRYIPASLVLVKRAEQPTATLNPNLAAVIDPNVKQAEQNLMNARKYLWDAYQANPDPAARQQIRENFAKLPIVPGDPTPANLPIQPVPNNQQLYQTASPSQPNNTSNIFNAASQTKIPSPPAGQAKWSDWGVLKKSTYQKEGQQYYVLTDRQGVALVYAIAEPGKDLAPHVNKMVSLYGTTTYRSDFINQNVITVSHVSLPQ